MSTTNFARKVIELTFELGNAATFDGANNRVTVAGHRVQARIKAFATATSGEASVRVYGLAPSILNQLVALDGASAMSRSNTIRIRAGNEGEALSLVFVGQIVGAQADMTKQPATALDILAGPSILAAATVLPPSSFPGSADAAVIMQNLAAQMNLAFENSGVSKMLSTPYFWGDAKKQAGDCARAAGFEWVIDRGVLAIWPKGGTRGGQVPLISTDTGLVGYPTYMALSDYAGLNVKTVFDPRLQVGGAVEIKSSLPFASGKWGVFELQHELEPEVAGGQWFTSFKARAYG